MNFMVLAALLGVTTALKTGVMPTEEECEYFMLIPSSVGYNYKQFLKSDACVKAQCRASHPFAITQGGQECCATKPVNGVCNETSNVKKMPCDWMGKLKNSPGNCYDRLPESTTTAASASSSNSCPISAPFAYKNGKHCCSEPAEPNKFVYFAPFQIYDDSYENCYGTTQLCPSTGSDTRCKTRETITRCPLSFPYSSQPCSDESAPGKNCCAMRPYGKTNDLNFRSGCPTGGCIGWDHHNDKPCKPVSVICSDPPCDNHESIPENLESNSNSVLIVNQYEDTTAISWTKVGFLGVLTVSSGILLSQKLRQPADDDFSKIKPSSWE